MNKSQWAENLLRDDYFVEMMQDLKNQEINRFTMSETNDIDSREQAYIRLRVIERDGRRQENKGWEIKDFVTESGGSRYN
jgi:hypothetical protein